MKKKACDNGIKLSALEKQQSIGLKKGRRTNKSDPSFPLDSLFFFYLISLYIHIYIHYIN